MIPALAFVRPDLLDNYMSELLDALPEELRPLYEYFEEYYVGRITAVRPNGQLVRATPIFPPEVWSVYERTVNEEARTNNFVEAAHRRLQAFYGVKHPTIWKFITGLRKFQHNRDAQMERYNSGRLPRPKSRRFLDTDRDLLNLVRTIDTRAPVIYLRGVAHNFLMD